MLVSLPLFYYPTRTIWVDDNEIFLAAANELLNGKDNIVTFADPNEALQFFEKDGEILSNLTFLRGCKDHEFYDTVNHSIVDFSVPSLSQLLSVPERCQEVSVVVVDYDMPFMDGITLCEKLRHLPCKKILLTGEADDKQAIAAFNSRIIDHYIRKNSHTLVPDIQSALAELQQVYFRERTFPLLTHLEADKPLPLSDPSFVTFFNNWCEVNNIVEYVLIDKNGSFISKDKASRVAYFIMHTDASLAAFVELNNEIKDSQHYLEAVQQRQLVPFFGVGKESWQFEVKDWSAFFYEPQILQGREMYYWAWAHHDKLTSSTVNEKEVAC